MDTIKKFYVRVDHETNEFVLTEPDFFGHKYLRYSLSQKYLKDCWKDGLDSGKYRIEEITPLPF